MNYTAFYIPELIHQRLNIVLPIEASTLTILPGISSVSQGTKPIQQTAQYAVDTPLICLIIYRNA